MQNANNETNPQSKSLQSGKMEEINKKSNKVKVDYKASVLDTELNAQQSSEDFENTKPPRKSLGKESEIQR